MSTPPPLPDGEQPQNPEERLEFLLSPREGEPRSKGSEEEQRRQEAIRLFLLAEAERLGVEIRPVGQHPPQSESLTPRANRIKQSAEPAMAEAASGLRMAGSARAGRDPQGHREVSVQGELNARIDLRVSLQGIVKLISAIGGGAKKTFAIGIKIGKHIHAKVAANSSDEDEF